MSNTRHARRMSDNTRQLETEARALAKLEGPTSLAASTLAIIDAHRRRGRSIEIVGIGRAGEAHPYSVIHWREIPSFEAERNGYLDEHGCIEKGQVLDRKTANAFGWIALITGMILGLSMGVALGPYLGH